MDEYKSEIRNFRKLMRNLEIHMEKYRQAKVKKQKILCVSGTREILRVNFIN